MKGGIYLEYRCWYFLILKRRNFFQTMQICGAGPYDQHLMLGEHELTDHSQSLAALGIFPGALLTLKVGRSMIIKYSYRVKKNRVEVLLSKTIESRQILSRNEIVTQLTNNRSSQRYSLANKRDPVIPGIAFLEWKHPNKTSSGSKARSRQEEGPPRGSRETLRFLFSICFSFSLSLFNLPLFNLILLLPTFFSFISFARIIIATVNQFKIYPRFIRSFLRRSILPLFRIVRTLPSKEIAFK